MSKVNIVKRVESIEKRLESIEHKEEPVGRYYRSSSRKSQGYFNGNIWWSDTKIGNPQKEVITRSEYSINEWRDFFSTEVKDKINGHIKIKDAWIEKKYIVWYNHDPYEKETKRIEKMVKDSK